MDKKKPVYENVKLPKNWGKIRIDGKLVNPTVKEILTVQSEDNQDYRIKKICPDCKKKYVEEPKPECDHIVGYRNESDEVPDGDDYKYYDHDIIVYLSELDTKADIENFLERKFKCCPLCETSLDWEAIEKKLNLKKDEEL